MDRRQFIQSTVAAGVITAAAPAFAAPAPRKRPNVLYVFDDEHRFQSLPGEKFSTAVVAPNLEAFRKSGFEMSTCISNYPLCSPHRGMFITGLWPYENGITRNWIELGTTFETLGHVFDKAGYRTSYVGKWHLSGPGHDRAFIPDGGHRQGFQDWHVWGAVDRHMSYSFTYEPDTGIKVQPQGYQTTLMTDQAVKIIHEQKASDKPWMMIVSWHPPHFPVDDAPAEDETFFAGKPVELRPNVVVGQSQRGHVRSKQALEEFHQGYYAHIRAVDREFGRLLKALDETGQAEDTIVIFSSDHGEMAGSHGRMYKQVPFEESIRVPFFVRYPGVTPQSKSSDVLFSSIDIYPTVCGLAGLPVPAHARGRDFSPIMKGHTGPDPDVVFLMNGDHVVARPAPGEQGEGEASAEANGGGHRPSMFRGLRTKTHTYAVAHDGRWILFDNRKDPYQLHNLIGDPAQKPLIAHFDTLLAEWLKQASDPFDLVAALAQRSPEPA